MASWPDLTKLKMVLGVTSDSKDVILQDALDAAVEQVKVDVSGSEAEFTEDFPSGPNAAIAQAALVLTVMVVKAPDAPYGVAAVFDTGGIRIAAQHPTYQQMLAGNRKTWGLR